MKQNKLLIIIVLAAAFFRFYNLTSVPPALYWDEASLGYNAFAIINSGIDEHGVRFPITHFLAYGDAKPPLYIYATAFSMKLFGVNEFAIRFPSALAGTIAVALTYFITRQLFRSSKKSSSLYKHVPLIAALLLAISPWHLQMSRAAFEANLALTFFLAGLYLFLKGRDNPKLWLLSSPFFIATLYTFNAYRIFLPFFLILLGVTFFSSIKTHFRYAVGSVILAAVLIAPLVPFVLSDQAKLRFNEVTIFNNHDPVIEANLRQELNNQAPWANIIHNRRVLFALEFLDRYADNLRPEFLFFTGDANPRFSIQEMGVLYLIELPLLIIGLYILFKSDKKIAAFISGWLLLAIIPAAVARETPHALRILQILPTYQIFIAVGIAFLIHKHKLFKPALILIYAVLVIFYLNTYYRHYPVKWASSWQYGYKQLVQELEKVQDNYDTIFVTGRLGRPHTYLLLYQQYDPKLYIESREVISDPFGLIEINGFDKYRFTDPTKADLESSASALIVSDKQIEGKNVLSTITDPEGNVVFTINENQ